MKSVLRLAVALGAMVLSSGVSTAPVAAQRPPICAIPPPALETTETWEQYQSPEAEQFLLTARVVGTRFLGSGVTRPKCAELELNKVRRIAVFKTIDERKEGITRLATTIEINFQDSWQLEVAAYQIDRIIGLRMVPATVERYIAPDRGSMQWWVESMMSEFDRVTKKVSPPDAEAWERVTQKMHLFDQLIANVDRHLNNVLVTKDFDLRLIDHSRSFRAQTDLKDAKILQRFSRSLLDGIKKLEFADLRKRVGKYLLDNQIRAMLARRDAILKLAETRIAEKGEAAVIYP
jgi:hypothetical protein